MTRRERERERERERRKKSGYRSARICISDGQAISFVSAYVLEINLSLFVAEASARVRAV